MPSYDLDDLELEVRQRADMENSEFVTTVEVQNLICGGAEELDNILEAQQAHNYRRKTFILISSAAETQYELPTDFKRLLAVRYLYNGELFPIQAFMPDSIVEITRRSNWTFRTLPRYNIYLEPAAIVATNLVDAKWMIEFDTLPLNDSEQLHINYIPAIQKLTTSGGS